MSMTSPGATKGTNITMSFTRAIAFPSAATSVIVTFSNKGNCFLFLAKMINILIFAQR
jgi:hypothetical protein